MVIKDLLNQAEFSELLSEHCMDVLIYFLENNIEFGILCNLADVTFETKLPDNIYSSLKPLSLFMVAGYSFESAFLREDEVLSFEAGFGRENFGTIVNIPAASILQIVVGETVVFINLTATIRTKKKESINVGSQERSLDAILANPANKKLFKNIKK